MCKIMIYFDFHHLRIYIVLNESVIIIVTDVIDTVLGSIFGLSTESMDLWIPLRTFVSSSVPIFPKIRALEFSDFFIEK